MSDGKEYLYRHERRTQEKRQAIAEALKEGMTYREIERRFNTSSATISAVKRLMEGQD